MQSKVPLPTDNIYKFYAFFGLLLLITSLYLFVTTYNDHRARAHDRYIELSKLEVITKLPPEQEKYKELLENQAVIDQSNKSFYITCISIALSISISLMLFGFGMWQFVIQPKQDKITQLGIEKLELELKMLKKKSQQTNTRFRK